MIFLTIKLYINTLKSLLTDVYFYNNSHNFESNIEGLDEESSPKLRFAYLGKRSIYMCHDDACHV